MPHITSIYRGATFRLNGVVIQVIPIGRHGVFELMLVRQASSGLSWGVVAWDGVGLYDGGPGDNRPLTPGEELPVPFHEALVAALVAANPRMPQEPAAYKEALTQAERDAAMQRQVAYMPRKEGVRVLVDDTPAIRVTGMGFALPGLLLRAGTLVRNVIHHEGRPATDVISAAPACATFQALVERRWVDCQTSRPLRTHD